MKVKIFTNEYDYETKEYRSFDAEIDDAIDEYLAKTISDGKGITGEKYVKIGNVVVPTYRIVAIKLEGK